MTEEALAELERLLTEMLAWAEARGEELYRLHAEVARLRELVTRWIELETGPMRKGDLQTADRLVNDSEAALSTPADIKGMED